MFTPRAAINTYFFINGVAYANWASRLPAIQSNYSLDNKLLGFVLLVYSIGAFIAMPVTGWLILKYGSKVTTALSAVLFLLCFILIPLAADFYTLLVPFFLMGASTGVMDVAMNAQAVIVEKNLKKPIMTFFHAMFSIGMVVGALLGSIFTKLEWTLFPHFLTVGVVSIVIICFYIPMLVKDPIETTQEEQVLFAMPKGVVIGLGIIAFCCMIGEGAMSDWSTNYMLKIVNVTDSFAAFGLTAFASMMTVGRLFGDKGRLTWGDNKMLLSGAILSLVGMVMIVGWVQPIIAIVGFGMVGLGLSNIVPIVYSRAGNLPDIPSGVGIAMATTIGYSGFMFGPPVIGFIADASDLRIALSLFVPLFLLMLLLVWRFARRSTSSE